MRIGRELSSTRESRWASTEPDEGVADVATDKMVDRRRFLQGTAAVAATAALAGCQSADRTPDSGVQGTGVTLPTHRKLSAVEPALPRDAAGVPDGYLEFPHPAEPVVDTPPGKGGTVTAMLGLAGGVTPKPLTANPWWQELNRRLGVQLDITVVPQEYPAKPPRRRTSSASRPGPIGPT